MPMSTYTATIVDDMPTCPLCREGELEWSSEHTDTLLCMSCDLQCRQTQALMLLIHTLQNEVASLRRVVHKLAKNNSSEVDVGSRSCA